MRNSLVLRLGVLRLVNFVVNEFFRKREVGIWILVENYLGSFIVLCKNTFTVEGRVVFFIERRFRRVFCNL